MPGWGGALLGSVGSLLVAVLVLWRTRVGDRRAIAREAARRYAAALDAFRDDVRAAREPIDVDARRAALDRLDRAADEYHGDSRVGRAWQAVRDSRDAAAYATYESEYIVEEYRRRTGDNAWTRARRVAVTSEWDAGGWDRLLRELDALLDRYADALREWSRSRRRNVRRVDAVDRPIRPH